MVGIAGYMGGNAKDIMLRICKAAENYRGSLLQCYQDQAGQIGIGLFGKPGSAEDSDTQGNNQPIISQDDRYVLMLNGRIYDKTVLRDQLSNTAQQNVLYHHISDSELLLGVIAEIGPVKTLDLLDGAFAFCLYDKKEKIVRLVRDRAGEKPLFYGRHNGDFLFMSDLSGLEAMCIRPAVDRQALSLYCSYGYYPAPYTAFESVYKLLPGHMMTVKLPFTHLSPQIEPYWDARAVMLDALANPFGGSAEDAVRELGILLKESVSKRMVTDKPPGAFLSGGVDSSLVAAIMQELSPQKIETFTIGFNESVFNEAVHAKAIAAHLGTSHSERYITSREAADVIPLLPKIYAEPFGDSSQIPTYLACKLARSKTAVSFSGDAGDELFGGYNAYAALDWAKRVPLRKLAGTAAGIAARSPLGYLCNRDVLLRGGKLLRAQNDTEALRSLREFWAESPLVLGMNPDKTYPSPLCCCEDIPADYGVQQRMMYADFRMCLPDDMLVKLGSASGAVSLDARVPLLDRKIIEFAWSLPMQYKIRSGVRKWPLRQNLYKRVPKELIERPKQGFGMPVHAWLTGPLREWAEDLLNEKRMREQGFFNTAYIRRGWKHFISNKGDTGRAVWFILMFQAWLEDYNGAKGERL